MARPTQLEYPETLMIVTMSIRFHSDNKGHTHVCCMKVQAILVHGTELLWAFMGPAVLRHLEMTNCRLGKFELIQVTMSECRAKFDKQLKVVMMYHIPECAGEGHSAQY